MSASVLLALGAALCFGVSDYLSGVLSRRLSILDVLAVGGLVGLAVIIVLLPLFPQATASGRDLAWGTLAGIAAAAGVLLLLRGFRVGRFGVVSPVSSVGAAGIPVIVGLALGEQPSLSVLAGLVAGIVSIWLVSGTQGGAVDRPATAAGLWEGLASGVMFAGMFLALSRADFASGPWPVVALQVGVLAVILFALLLQRRRPRVTLDEMPGVALVGVTAVVGTLAFIYSARLGLVSIAAVISAMSPAITVVLARVLIAEHFTQRQLAGLAVAAAAIVLIGFG